MMYPGLFRLIVCTLPLMVAAASCSSSRTVAVNRSETLDDSFKPSKVSVDRLLAPLDGRGLNSIQGRARVQFSSPESSERGIAEFVADRTNMVVSIRNNLGITGGSVLVDSDSVLLYYNHDHVAWKFSIEDYESLPDIRLRLPLNLMSVIKPRVLPGDIVSVQENATYYLLLLNDGSELILDRESGLPNMIRYKTEVADRFSEFSYESYSTLNGITLPRRILAVTDDRKNRIRLDVVDLQVNPSNPQFSLNIPQGVPIFR